ncbi:DUF3263 domain-containing protein [Rhodococcus ruber]|uniref:DUF3263 domain-containing protein n=1 Tax=Rhodococcus TaxID=1827 RepID=UPI00029AC973|nr:MULTISPECIES: DUF3263 domain-containing protein [Rhodococcus]AWH00628.1 DUF3263 domain-containing protein [Rhodococcus ruber]MCZ1074409.1 DUF3263 domain-containing protein [Rhodococcus sp. A5(2022)]QDC16029.1 DUF3263 domain-containing protein [Rhodococcus ruber]UIR35069.1 DUF3263 domain-containing protein [Rhodococcus sp. DMF-1]
MTKDEVALLDFAVQWAPYGGGDEHILPEFGLVPTDFYHRLRCLLDAQPKIDAGTRRRLKNLCTRKLGYPPVVQQKPMSRSRRR